ncbi:hypothetical protein ACJX0J_021461, partial [Zea mays]
MTAWSKREHPIHLGIYVVFVLRLSFFMFTKGNISGGASLGGDFTAEEKMYIVVSSFMQHYSIQLLYLPKNAVYLAKDEKACTRSVVLDGYHLYMLKELGSRGTKSTNLRDHILSFLCVFLLLLDHHMSHQFHNGVLGQF